MPNVLVNDESLSAIGSAIRDKSGTVDTYKPSEMAQAIRDIPQSGFVEAPDNDVIFIDAYGNRIYSYTYEESKNLTELPPLPVDEDIEFDRWNWSLEDLHNNEIYKTDVVIGPEEKKNLDYAKIVINVNEYSLYVRLAMYSNTTGDVDWGDGNVESFSDSTQYFEHKYEKSGLYKIILNNISQPLREVYVKSNYEDSYVKDKYCVIKLIGEVSSNQIQSYYNLSYINCLQRNAYDYLNLKTIIVPRESREKALTFNECHNLKYISLPYNSNIEDIKTRYSLGFRKILIPQSLKKFENVATNIREVDFTKANDYISFTTGGSTTHFYPFTIKVKASHYKHYIDNFLPDSSVEYYKFIPIGNALYDINPIKSLFNTSNHFKVKYISSDKIIPNITFSSTNDQCFEISNLFVDEEYIEFDLITKEIEDKVTITLSADFNGEILNKDFIVNIKESFPIPTYTVEDVSGASYNFIMNDSGYYESTNKKIQNSASVCKVIFNNAEGATITFNCINYAESNYDYGIIGQPNVELTLNNTDDGATGSAKVLKNFKGLSTPTVQQFIYNSVENEFFIYVKYRKDSSGDNSNDSFQFNIEFS